MANLPIGLSVSFVDIGFTAPLAPQKIFRFSGVWIEDPIMALLLSLLCLSSLSCFLDEFIESYRIRMETTLKSLKEDLASVGKTTDLSYIWNIRDYKYLMDRAERMTREAKSTLLISAWKEEMRGLEKVLEKAESKRVRIAVIHSYCYKGRGQLGIDPIQCKSPTVIIIVADIQVYPEEYYKKGIEIITASTRRIPSACLDTRVKSLNYLNNILER